MQLFFDSRDLANARKLKDDRHYWLQDLGACDLTEKTPNCDGFLFGYALGADHLRRQTAGTNIHDTPEERDELLDLDRVLQALAAAEVQIPTPRTWVMELDDPLPRNLSFPLFVRTPRTSCKRGGAQSRVNNARELVDEADMMRRALGWDTRILAREWIDIAPAGPWMFGDAPQEIRTWIVDGVPRAWSFHYLHAVPEPSGFPPASSELNLIAELAARVARPFRSRLIAADFVKAVDGSWWFLEAGPGAVAGTGHEAVFKYVAGLLRGDGVHLSADAVGGPL